MITLKSKPDLLRVICVFIVIGLFVILAPVTSYAQEEDQEGTSTSESDEREESSGSSDAAEGSGGGSANDRITTFINLAKGKNATDAKVGDMTPEEARFLGVYLSNFYVPFGSEFSPGSTNTVKKDSEKEEKSTVEAMAKVLQDKLAFSEETAVPFARYVAGNVWRGGKKLEVGYTTGDDLYDIKKAPQVKNLSWPVFMQMVTNRYYLTHVGYNQKKEEVKKYLNEAKYGVLYYEEGGKKIPVFNWNAKENKMTPSVAALYQSVSMMQLEQGYGNSLFDIKASELPLTGNDLDRDKVKVLTDAGKAYNVTFFNSTMHLSPFGDLVVRGPNHTFVAIPGALNPGTWIPVEGDKDGAPSSAYIAANYQNLLLRAQNKSGFKDLPNDVPPVSNVKFDFDVNSVVNRLQFESRMDADPFHVLRGGHQWKTQMGAEARKVPPESWSSTGEDFAKQIMEDVYKSYPAVDVYNCKVHHKYNDLVCPYIIFGSANGSPNLKENMLTLGTDGRDIKVSNRMIIADTLGAPVEGAGSDTDNYVPVMSVKINEGIGKIENTQSVLDQVFQSSEEALNATAASMPKAAASSIYITYLVAQYGDTEAIKKLGFKFNPDLPAVKNLSLKGDPKKDAERESKKRIDTITNYLYFLLNPNWEFVNYFAQLVTSKVAGFLVRWHQDMTGTQASGIVAGTTKYIGFAGFVSTPNLNDLQWTDAIVNIYNDYVIFLIIFVVIVLCLMVILKSVTWQQAVVSTVVFTFLALSIVPVMNAIINRSNAISDGIYSEKFTYWALVTQQTYDNKINEYATEEDYQNYLKEVFNNSPAEGEEGTLVGSDGVLKPNYVSNRGGENILLKWQAPKKQMSKAVGKDVNKASQGSALLRGLMGNVVERAGSGETYLQDPNSTFLYRSYTDISNASRFTYSGLSERWGAAKQKYNNAPSPNWPAHLAAMYNNMNQARNSDISQGFTNPLQGDSNANSQAVNVAPLTSNIINEVLTQRDKINNTGLTLNDYVGAPAAAFKGTILPFTRNGVNIKEDLEEQLGQSAGGSSSEDSEGSAEASDAEASSTEGSDITPNNVPKTIFDPQNYSDEDFASLSAFSLMTESPFYAFSWNLYDQGVSPEGGATEGYLNLLLNQPNQGFFYNNNVYNAEGEVNEEGATAAQSGALKDFMNMRGLFSYTIPYLNSLNQIVRDYDARYGLKFYPGLPFEPGHEDDPEIAENKELRQKYWQNVNVNQLSNIYSPWVDLMYDAGYAQAETISVQGERVVIEDPINPASYPAERPMVFSPAEAAAFGLKESDLTSVERRIFKTLENSKNKYFELLNYYTFNDSVMNTGAAMMGTFEFNKAFSENKWFGFKQDIQLYPQSYELKNFSYDAYLRLILANSLGKDLLEPSVGGSFYLQVVQESSLTTAIMLIVTDLLSIYIIPLLKYASILALLVVTILLIITSVLKSYEGSLFKKVWSVVIVPLLKIFFIIVGMTWVISLFMGDPVSSVTGGSKFSIKFGDPVVTLMALTVTTIIVAYLLAKTLMGIMANIKNYGSMFMNSSVGAAGGVAAKGAGKMGKVLSHVGVGAAGAVAGAAWATSRKSGQIAKGQVGKKMDQRKKDREYLNSLDPNAAPKLSRAEVKDRRHKNKLIRKHNKKHADDPTKIMPEQYVPKSKTQKAKEATGKINEKVKSSPIVKRRKGGKAGGSEGSASGSSGSGSSPRSAGGSSRPPRPSSSPSRPSSSSGGASTRSANKPQQPKK